MICLHLPPEKKSDGHVNAPHLQSAAGGDHVTVTDGQAGTRRVPHAPLHIRIRARRWSNSKECVCAFSIVQTEPGAC